MIGSSCLRHRFRPVMMEYGGWYFHGTCHCLCWCIGVILVLTMFILLWQQCTYTHSLMITFSRITCYKTKTKISCAQMTSMFTVKKRRSGAAYLKNWCTSCFKWVKFISGWHWVHLKETSYVYLIRGTGDDRSSATLSLWVKMIEAPCWIHATEKDKGAKSY